MFRADSPLEPHKARRSSSGLPGTRLTLAVLGTSHLIVSVLFFFAPAWSFEALAHFAPFNAHFIADIGAFNLPLGLGLLLASSDPQRHRTLIGLAAVGNLAHAVSHLRDWDLHLPPHLPLAVGLTLELVSSLLGVVLLGIYLLLRPVRAVRGV
jgi:hypothetical protein